MFKENKKCRAKVKARNRLSGDDISTLRASEPGREETVATKPRTKARSKLDALGMDGICARTADCIPMRTIAADVGVSWATLAAFINETPERIEQYTRAREAQADKLADDMLAIADDGSSDTYTDENGNERTNQEVVARSRLRIDARKWLASKMAPKRYGEKLDITADVTTRDRTDEQLRERAAQLAEKLGLAKTGG